jgi:hypothetical protein
MGSTVCRLKCEGRGMTSLLNLLEVCGVLSFNLSAAAPHALYVHFPRRYGVTVVPAAAYETRLPATTAVELRTRMEQRMALEGAEIALIVALYADNVTAFLSRNAKHFEGKLPVPAMTPSAWLRRRPAGKKR